jgi:hypothetical protein
MKQFKFIVSDSLVSMSVCFSLKNTLELNGTTWNYFFPDYFFRKKLIYKNEAIQIYSFRFPSKYVSMFFFKKYFGIKWNYLELLFS